MHLTVFNVVPRLALIGDAGGAVGEDGAEFLSLPDTAGTLFLTLFPIDAFAWSFLHCAFF